MRAAMSQLRDWVEFRRCLRGVRRDARDFWSNVTRWDWSEPL